MAVQQDGGRERHGRFAACCYRDAVETEHDRSGTAGQQLGGGPLLLYSDGEVSAVQLFAKAAEQGNAYAQ
jgi:hypothetical protein